MRDLRFRYVWKRKHDRHIYCEIVPIECLEKRGDAPFLGNDLWELVGRDQFTGFRDKNRCDIYEGDILPMGGNPNAYVEWDSTMGQWSLAFHVIGYAGALRSYNESVEVIGNIHENQDLLK